MKRAAAITTAGVAWLLTFFSATAGAQEQHPNLDRGFDPAKLYQFDQVDAIDLYNGRLTVQIPLGQRYQVGPALSYGLTLYYNSNVWDFEPAQRNGGPGEPCMKAEPRERWERDWDAGMGWRLSLGELTFRPIAEDLDEWTYIGPDGADHRFYQTLHSGELRDPGHVYYYTRDGSYLRLVVEDESEPRQATVSFPDGTRQLFQENGDGSRRYRLARLLDPWSLNVVEVEYPVVPVVPGELWKLTDSFGRIQKAYTTWVGGSSPVVVDRVELTAFDGATLTYQFDYEIKNIRRSCKETCRTSSDPDWLVNVPLLTSLVAAAGTGELARREFQYYENTADCSIAFSNPPCGDTETFVAKDAPGVLKQLMLPTRGTITYAYEDRLLLQRDENRPCNLPDCRVEEVIEFATGVVRKVAHDPYGAQTCGVWRYTTDHHTGSVQHGQVWVSFLDELVTKVTSPAGDDTVHYFSGGIDPQDGTPQQWHTGLPFAPLRSDGGDRFLASEAFAGGATVNCSGTSCVTGGNRKRADFSMWEKDEPELPGHPEYIGFNLNRRVSASRTYYTDDPSSDCAVPSATDSNSPNPCRFQGVQSSAFDGLGHYRQQTTEGNFDAGDQHTIFTNYNPLAGTYPGGFTLPPWTVPWILTTYDRIDTIDSTGTARREYCFAKDAWGYPTTGFLLRQRVLSSNNGGRSDKDLVTVLTADNRGFLAEERFFGGDVQPVELGELCTLPLPASDEYRLVHTYQYGTRATSEYRDAAGAAVLRTLDRDIDQFTGLPRTERDVSGLLTTDFIYDALGRLTWVRPAEGAWTRYRFYPAQVSTDPNLAARVEVCSKANGDARDGCAFDEPGWQETLTRSAYRFNGFGRLFAERTRMPTATYGPEPAVPYEPGASTKWNERRTVYNALGWKTGVSEVAANGSPTRWTTFSAYDPFGRVGTITLPDGTSTTFSYTGARLIARTVTVSGQPATTTEEYDRQGRLSNVTEPAGAGGSNVTTTYGYDVGGRLTSVVQGGQTRSFAYDGRGFLLWEDLPEKEPVPGQAHDVLYGRYDARGHARWVRDGEVATAALLDRAERPTHLYDADSLGNPVAPMVRWYSYATSNDGANRRQGKLEKAWAKTIQPTASPDPSASAEIEDTFTYAGVGGRISQKKTWVKVAGSAVANPPERNFVQSYTYDALGNVASVSYPWDGSLGPTVPRRRVDYRYGEGRLTSVLPYYATGIAYHYNGMVHQVTTGKRVVELQSGPLWQQTINPSTAMARPQEIRSVGVTLSGSAGVPADWSTGTYGYDGAGNITAMGGETYTYDKVSRLESSTRHGGENYTYDAFGNLTAMNGLLRTTDPATNRLTEAAYDLRGNLRAWGGQGFTWDTMGRMTSMQGPGINRSMFYDANGERLVVRDGSGYTFTLRDLGQEVLREVSWSSAAGWKWGKDYVYRDGVLLASQSTTAGEGLRYHFPDHLTSPRLLTNRCGERAVEHRASSFGVDVLGGSSQSADRMRFTMHERDLGQLSTTLDDLDYMHARTYWPSLGRFMSVDPLSPASLQFGDADDRSRFAESIRQPGRWNRYAYVNNNPMKFIDPNGEAIEGALVATSPIFFSEGAATGGTVVATGAAPLVLAGAAGLALGYGVNQIPGVSEALTHQGLSDGLANIFFAGAANDTRQFIDTKVATVLKHVGQYGSPPPNDPDKRSRLKNVYERMKKHLEQAEKKLKNLKGKSKEEYARLIKQTAEKLENGGRRAARERQMSEQRHLLDAFERALVSSLGPGAFRPQLVGDLDDLLFTLEGGVRLLRELAEHGHGWQVDAVRERLYAIEFLLTEELPPIAHDLVPAISAARKAAERNGQR